MPPEEVSERVQAGRFVVTLAVAWALGLTLASPAGAQVVERRDSVEGTLHVAPPCTGPPPCIDQPRYAFHIVTEADGSGPQGTITYSTGERSGIRSVSGPVTCVRIQGNRATVAANLTEPAGTPGEPQSVLVFLEDNGPAEADRWLVRTLPLGTAPSACPADPPAGTSLGPGYPGRVLPDPGVTIVDQKPGPLFKRQCRRLGWLQFGFASRAECEAFVVRTRALAGSIRELPIPTANTGVSDIAAGADGRLWFTEPNANQIGRVSTTGDFREFPLPEPNSYPNVITRGPDGAQWFVEALGRRFGRIDASGAVTEFPTPGGSYSDLTAGPDGALWFTGSQFPQPRTIGRITTAGALSAFPIGDQGNYTQDITRGPDGALWFTYPLFGVGRLSTSGQVTRYPVTGGAFAITPGPGGALWFTQLSARSIGRIVPGGQTSVIPYQSGIGSAESIAAGADGALWFTLSGGQIGRLTPNGAFTLFPLPTLDSAPNAIAAGPDGALWFTEQGANKIGQIPARPRNRGQCGHLGWLRMGFTNRRACEAFVQYVPPA